MADQASQGLLSPFLRRQRIAAARRHLSGRVLDVGCGSGLLAELVPADRYVGVEVDEEALQIARASFPRHRFEDRLPSDTERFDTVVSLAVIEHVEDPVQFLRALAQRLEEGVNARIVCTTPHPAMDWIHDLGARLGLFSQHASEEHEDLLGREKLDEIGQKAGLVVAQYQRFLLGANQLVVFARSGDHNVDGRRW